MPDIDDIDRKILNLIQSDFPVTCQPFLTIAEILGMEEDDVINRIQNLKRIGIIRRIGGNFVPDKMGFVSTLCAAQAKEDKIREFAEIVNLYLGVTHNYLRDDKFNVWFTFIAGSASEIETNLKEISEKTKVGRILNLPAVNVFKIKAHFNLN